MPPGYGHLSTVRPLPFHSAAVSPSLFQTKFPEPNRGRRGGPGRSPYGSLRSPHPEAIVANTKAVPSSILYHPTLKVLGSVSGVAKNDVFGPKLAGRAVVGTWRVVAKSCECGWLRRQRTGL